MNLNAAQPEGMFSVGSWVRAIKGQLTLQPPGSRNPGRIFIRSTIIQEGSSRSCNRAPPSWDVF